MISLEDSILHSLDAADARLLPHLPYILQDLDELGSDPAIVSDILHRHCNRPSECYVLDLGCGKGAVSVRLAAELGCRCHGIDALPAFVEAAASAARARGVAHLCGFETGDARTVVASPPDYDAIVLGSVGPIFSDYEQTLLTLLPRLRAGGIIILDDCYRVEETDSSAHSGLSRSALLRQIHAAGMEVRDEVLSDARTIRATNALMYAALLPRCLELMDKYPDDRELFEQYLLRQREENHALENDLVCATLVLGVRTKLPAEH